MDTLSSKLKRIQQATDRIRAKTNTESNNIEGVASVIENMKDYTLGTATLTENKTYAATDFDFDGLETIIVDVPKESAINFHKATSQYDLPHEGAVVGDIGLVYEFTEAGEGLDLESKFNSFSLPKEVIVPSELPSENFYLSFALADAYDENGVRKEDYFENYIDGSIRMGRTSPETCDIDLMGRINGTEVRVSVQYVAEDGVTYKRSLITAEGVECFENFIKLPMDLIVTPDTTNNYHEYMSKLFILGTFIFKGIYRFEHLSNFDMNYWVPIGSEQDI